MKLSKTHSEQDDDCHYYSKQQILVHHILLLQFLDESIVDPHCFRTGSLLGCCAVDLDLVLAGSGCTGLVADLVAGDLAAVDPGLGSESSRRRCMPVMMMEEVRRRKDKMSCEVQTR